MGITRYEHHGVEMAVREDMKGRHRDHCLCFSCAKFHPEDRERNCRVANLLYAVCQAMGIVTPVWECGAGYEEKERWEFDIWAGKHTAYVEGFEFGVPYRFRWGDGAEVVGIITGFDWDEENKVKRLVVQPIEDRGQELAVLEVEKIRG